MSTAGPEYEAKIPVSILGKLVNRRRRQVRMDNMGLSSLMEAMRDLGKTTHTKLPQELVDMALDELCAWAEEHAPELFYTEKGPANE